MFGRRPAAHRDVDITEAERLVRTGEVRVLDVRNPEEHAELGHIPGAILLPLDRLPEAFGSLPREGKPILVCCEGGVRSKRAAAFLAQNGFTGLLNLAQGMACWTGPREFPSRPSS